MLTPEEKNFINYWEMNRNRKKRVLWQLAAGLPLGVFLALAICVNYFSGWYQRAAMEIKINTSGVLVVLIALVLVIVFVAVFSARHKWEMNEQRYKELMAKKDVA
jgi:membrane protein YdbS with pleckstrin-like domain